MQSTYLILSDTQIPDQNEEALTLIKKFIPDLKPDFLILNGDIVNFTTVSTYGYPADYKIGLDDELKICKSLLKELVRIAREANPEVQIFYLFGNHEARLEKYLNAHGRELFDLKDELDQRVLSLEHLLGLYEMGIKHVPYSKDIRIDKAVLFHGDRARKNSGYTAHSYLQDWGESIIVGHTHRLGLVFKTHIERAKFGMETGCLCNADMKVAYTRHPDWMTGFGVLVLNHDTNTLHPTIVPIINGEFTFGGKLYN